MVIRRNFLYIYKSLKYVLIEVMKHNVDVFSMRTYVRSRASSIALELFSNALQYTIISSENTSKPNVFVSLISLISGIKYTNYCDSKIYLSSIEDM